MAANSSSRRVILSLGKRYFVNIDNNHQIWTRSSPSHRLPVSLPPSLPAAAAFRRSAHSSVYDKNLDDHITSSVVPDDVVRPQSEKYWAPNPQTGVFGPAGEQTSSPGSESGLRSSPAGTNGGSESALEQKAFFRPLENLEKPHHP